MVVLQCPECGTHVEERPGVVPQCPKCGFSDRPAAPAAGAGAAPASSAGAQGAPPAAPTSDPFAAPADMGPSYDPYGSSGPAMQYSASPYGATASSYSAPTPPGPVPGQVQQQGMPAGAYQARPTNGLAVTSMILGIVGFCVFFTALVAIPLGIVARNQCRQRNEAGEGMALAGIVLGSIVVGFGILYFLFIGMIIGGF